MRGCRTPPRCALDFVETIWVSRRGCRFYLHFYEPEVSGQNWEGVPLWGNPNHDYRVPVYVAEAWGLPHIGIDDGQCVELHLSIGDTFEAVLEEVPKKLGPA